MQRDRYTTTEDFLQDPSFRRWVQEGWDDTGWESWLKEAPHHQAAAREAQLLLLAMGVPEQALSETATEDALTDIWGRLRQLEAPSVSPFRKHWIPWAAAVLLLTGIGWYSYRQQLPMPPETERAIHELKKSNTTHAPQLITLADGSSVLLQPGSELHYPSHFTGPERRVLLVGEAFFEVSKDPSHPFIVDANELVTRVIGTSFRIKAYRNQPNVEVTVRTGQVQVSARRPTRSEPAREISLFPNESILFVRENAVFEKPVVTQKQPGRIEQLQFEFKDTPVSHIFETIEAGYGIRVLYPETLLKECYLSTSLTDEPLQEKLKIICESLGNNSRYEFTENQITIFSNGCH